MNLSEFYRASSTLNPKLTLLISKGKHFVPITQLTIAEDSLLLDTKDQFSGGPATITLDQFLTRTSHLPLTTNLRTSNNHALLFGFRIVNRSIVFY
ncbi:MAG: hypothetical protein DUD34_10875 [Lactobacillus sp.]|nr:MAG: hypothetical protein DUD34_10875 [Lactobacillus sp.]